MQDDDRKLIKNYHDCISKNEYGWLINFILVQSIGLSVYFISIKSGSFAFVRYELTTGSIINENNDTVSFT